MHILINDFYIIKNLLWYKQLCKALQSIENENDLAFANNVKI